MVNKKLGLIFILFLIIPIFNVFEIGYGYDLIEVNPGVNPTADGQSQRSFYSNFSKRFYVIYQDGANPVPFYRFSFDGDNWVSNREFSAFQYDDQGLSYAYFDFWLEPNGKYFWYARIDRDYNPDKLIIRKHEITPYGNIIAIESEQDIYPSGYVYQDWEVHDGLSICTNSEGYPFIAFSAKDVSNAEQWHWICWTDLNNGTWGNTYDRYYYEIGGDKREDGGDSRVLPMEKGAVCWILCCGEYTPQYREWWYDYTWNGTDITDDSIGAFTFKTIDADNAGGVWLDNLWSATSYQDSVYIIYTDSDLTWDRIICEGKHGKGAWINETVVKSFPDRFMNIQPFISSDRSGNLIVFWYQVGNNSYYYRRRRNNYTWDLSDSLWRLHTENISRYEYGSGCQLYGYGKYTCPVSVVYNGSLWHDWMFIGFSNETLDIPFQFYNASIINAYAGNWLFQGEVYDVVSWVKNCTLFWLNFTDGRNEIRFIYNRTSKEMYAECENENVIGIIYTNNETYANETYKLTWRFILGSNIQDNIDIDLYYYIYNEYYNTSFYGDTGIDFNIYNLGEKIYYTFSGDSGKVVGGHPYEIYATNSSIPGGSFGQVYTLKRKWQHFHTVFAWDFGDHECPDHDEETGKVQFGIQYLNESTGVWTSSYRVNLYVIAGSVDAPIPIIGGGKDWVKIKVEWSNYLNTTYYSIVKTDYITAYYDGGPNKENRTTVRLFADMWISSLNQSTIVAGRVNSYYYGMNQTGFLFWSNWKPFITSTEVSTFYDDFRNPSGNVISSLDIELIKHYAFLQKLTDTGSGEVGDEDCDTHTWTLTGFTELHHKVADDRYVGLDQAPPYEETKVIDMPQSGFLAVIYKALSSLGSVIWMGALKFIRTLIVFLDQIFEWIGLPSGFFSRIMEFILSLPQLFILIVNQIGFMITYSIQIVTDMFTVIGLMIYRILYFSGTFVNMIVQYYNQIVSLFTGGWSSVRNLWDMLELGTWIEFFIVAIFPLWEFYRITSAKDPLKQLKDDIDFFWGIISGIFGIFRMFLDVIKGIIGAIRNVLPI